MAFIHPSPSTHPLIPAMSSSQAVFICTRWTRQRCALGSAGEKYVSAPQASTQTATPFLSSGSSRYSGGGIQLAGIKAISETSLLNNSRRCPLHSHQINHQLPPMNVFNNLPRKHKCWVCIIWYGSPLFSVVFLERQILANNASPARTSVLWKRFSECFSVNTSVSSPGSSLFFLASISGLSSLSISSGDCGTRRKTEHRLETVGTASQHSHCPSRAATKLWLHVRTPPYPQTQHMGSFLTTESRARHCNWIYLLSQHRNKKHYPQV